MNNNDSSPNKRVRMEDVPKILENSVTRPNVGSTDMSRWKNADLNVGDQVYYKDHKFVSDTTNGPNAGHYIYQGHEGDEYYFIKNDPNHTSITLTKDQLYLRPNDPVMCPQFIYKHAHNSEPSTDTENDSESDEDDDDDDQDGGKKAKKSKKSRKNKKSKKSKKSKSKKSRKSKSKKLRKSRKSRKSKK